MKDSRKHLIIIAGLFIAVFVLVTAKNMTAQKQIENLPDDSVVGQGKPVLLELGAHWCTPCKQMTPILNELSTEQQAFSVAFVNVQTAEGASQKYGIESIPTQIFFDTDGKELFRHVGFYPKEDILAKWKELGIEQ
ncbi:MAG: thioredoxin family protein [Planctomycetes bacterium]|nr:thioredoxin family protein [Planctomycetota bacterium]